MVMTATGDLLLPLMGTPSAVGLARTLVDARIRNWTYFHILDNALLVVSELVTNAARQTPHQEIRLQLSRDRTASSSPSGTRTTPSPSPSR
jgi:hypothetical protein